MNEPFEDTLARLDAQLQPACTIVRAGLPCGRPGAYIARIHICHQPDGGLDVICGEHMASWIDFDYPGECARCRKPFTNMTAMAWDIERLTDRPRGLESGR